MTSSYRDLIVWQRAMDLSVLVYEHTQKFPKNEIFGIVSQMRRAAVSIASNIAEGEGRKSATQFSQFISIALGSKAELETQTILCERLNYIKKPEAEIMLNSLAEIGKMLTSLKKKILSAPSKNNN